MPTVLHALQTNQVGAAYLVALAALLLCGWIVRRPEGKMPCVRDAVVSGMLHASVKARTGALAPAEPIESITLRLRANAPRSGRTAFFDKLSDLAKQDLAYLLKRFAHHLFIDFDLVVLVVWVRQCMDMERVFPVLDRAGTYRAKKFTRCVCDDRHLVRHDIPCLS
ncbi:hypothetical protein OKW41_000398 [Paraburkholderia sp. UCT70]|uniref:hypothetical protein n=1 Tax=Paraburkholderia sp. UCT70 TaxID=2991068 RepID=UPI003D20B963